MSNWTRSNMSRNMLRCLVEAGQLPPLTATVEWKVPGEESVSHPPKGYVISFVAFHERGFSVSARRFIWRSSTSTAFSCSTSTRIAFSRWRRRSGAPTSG
jgi:hypothetical protein